MVLNQPELHFGAAMSVDPADTARQAKWLEKLGYEYLAAGEHFMRGDPPAPSHASLPLLAVAAGATERIKVLSSILLIPFYHPLMLARVTATLDSASGGRLTLGVGVGGEFPEEFSSGWLEGKTAGPTRRRMFGGIAAFMDRSAGHFPGPTLSA